MHIVNFNLVFLQKIYKERNFIYTKLHSFRHTHAVHLLQSGDVSERLKNSTINITADVYLHVTKIHGRNSSESI